MAWHTYKAGKDGIVVTRVGRDGEVDNPHSIANAGQTHGPPKIVADSDRSVWVTWSAKVESRWHVMLRRCRNDAWEKSRRISDSEHDAIFPTAILDDKKELVAVWSERVGSHFQVRGSKVDSDTPLDFNISEGEHNAYRPVLTRHGNEVWAFWDQYRKPNYAIYGRRLLPTLGEIERVSPAGEYCLTPTACSHATGIHVAWLRKIDVIGGPRVISQWHTLHAAVRKKGQWTPVQDVAGKTEAAVLTQGLMAKIAPQPVATGGYLGSRVRPMLHSLGGQIWLFWERKTDHRGSTPKVPGDLLGRPTLGGKWQPPLVVHRGHVDYHVIHSPVNAEKRLTLIASKLPRRARRKYVRFHVDLADASPFKQEAWSGWSPVKLPIESEMTARREVQVGGKTFKLFWGDLHCHSNLSADAEGETDELNHYARDRAQLDVVVFTNNDFYNVPLTQYEYEVGNLLAASHSVEGKFLSLPGYEWTSRIPGVATASLDDAGNWLPPYRNRSYPNHRSVIYPPTGGPLVHFTEVGNDIGRLNEAVARAGGITLSQHPAFKLSGHKVEVGLELTSGWSNYVSRNPKLFHGALDQGLKTNGKRLGFVANGDSHRRAPGLSGALTGIYAESLTPQAILDALRKRRCFATSGSQIFIDARAGDSFMGQEAAAQRGRMTFTLRAIGTRPITAATLVRDSEEIHTAKGDGKRELVVRFTDEKLTSGTHWYYWRIHQDVTAPVLPGNLMTAHGHLAWSSPHWIVID